MCSIITSASHTTPNSPRSPSFPPGSTQPEVLWRDDNFTAYREKANPVSSSCHLIIAFNLHVPSIYTLSSTDLPLLVNVRNLANRLLTSFTPSATPSSPSTSEPPQQADPLFRIGFITPPFKDNKIPVTDHLHAHAYIMPADLMGWWRGIGYGPLAWYAIDDLIAEIRESVSNNRVKSGYINRPKAPIDLVPSAGARSGTADGRETTEPGLVPPVEALEEGQPSPLILPQQSLSLARQNRIPQLSV
ncbi:hypothetical protein AGABI2DRAFT_189994 [Agaricus bisporus var. bisporus H97]|uniref:hypothetical protein n=1 Tax=Agaricus bisporus var. bisporus (strain H97 / ATCC MYA-4626 / FGSC 10389) TaxID=936046 RepID=UPI00029F7274|nr:hypothetical protein AGABI2DRAFT_189994 [Agaricus bisporus var. bisporus H97]EKV51778.1 hypothetical protein AGABI2DRAFT_189994 [Agaricus bisporus var. bisporus H97]